MDEFLRRCREEFRVGLVQNEKEWLRIFYYDVEKCIRQNESDAEFGEVCFAILHQIKETRNVDDRVKSLCWLPISHQVMPLNTLSKTSKDVYGGSLVTSASQEESMVSGYSTTGKMPFILLGYLTLQPKSIKSTSATGTLYVEDNFEAVVCEVINPDRCWLETLVLFLEWNYVPLSSSSTAKDAEDGHGYFEIIRACAPILVTRRSSHDNKLDMCNVMTIKELQQDRSLTVNLNIHGNIYALSPIHSMASIGKPFFLVKLSCPVTNLTTSVVVQGEQFMFWHNFLQVGKQYVFHKLRETTMNKGTRNERKVLATSPHSDLCEYQPGNILRVSKSVKRPLEDKQGESKRPRIAKEQDDVSHAMINDDREILQLPRPRPPVNMSYTGVITNCIKPEAGLFELDNKIRLYISHQPSPNLGRGLRVGAHVTTHNIHLCKKGKKTLGLCCCTQSTVRVVKFSPLASPWKPFNPRVSPLALLAQNLTLADYVDLLEMCEKVLDKFSHLYRTSQLVSYSSKQNRHLKKESVLELLLSFVKRTSAAANGQSRNIYDEFFEVPHECHPNRASVLTFPWLPTIKEFLDTVSQKSAGEPWLSGILSNTTAATQEKEDWVYKIMSQECLGRPLILIGCLRSSSKTGQLKLLDQTGEITCMIAAADQQSTRHDCITHCCRKLSVEGKCPSCPYAQTWHTDTMIQINKFEVVMEKFQSKNLTHEDFAGDRIYLQFSFDNAEIIISKDTCRKRDCEGQTRCSGTGKESKICAKDEDANTSLDKGSKGFMCKIIFIVRNCEVATLRRVKEELCYPCGVEIKVVAVYRSEFQKAADTGFKLQRKTAALKLVKKSLCWFQFLHPGCFYIITETAPNEKCSRIIQDGNLHSLINVSSDMLLERICWCQSCRLALFTDAENKREIVEALDELKDDFLKNDSLDTVDSVLSNASCEKKDQHDKSLKPSSSSTLVSFRGLIVNRELRQSDTPSQRLPNELVEVPKFGPVKKAVVKGLQLGFTLLNNKIIQLRVRGLESPNSISVYLDLRRTTYICGIAPGAIVQFRRLVRKFSRSRNMYCTFEACSSIVVERRAITNLTDVQLNPQSSVSATTSNPEEEVTKQLPYHHLIELIESEAQGKFVQTISWVSCRVTAVQKATLRWLCKRCEGLVTRNECTAGCFSTKGYKLHAEVRCVVEDGTGEAQLYVYDDMVPTVLKVTSQQWRHLQDLAMRTGELVYQRHNWFGGNRKLNQGDLSSREAEARMTLKNHCCSSQVKRRVMLECKLFRFNKTTGDGRKQGYETRSIRVGPTEHSTLVLPKLFLRAVSISDLCTVGEIRRLLEEAKREKKTKVKPSECKVNLRDKDIKSP